MTAVRITLVISDWDANSEESVIDIALGYVSGWLGYSALTPDSVTVELAQDSGEAS